MLSFEDAWFSWCTHLHSPSCKIHSTFVLGSSSGSPPSSCLASVIVLPAAADAVAPLFVASSSPCSLSLLQWWSDIHISWSDTSSSPEFKYRATLVIRSSPDLLRKPLHSLHWNHLSHSSQFHSSSMEYCQDQSTLRLHHQPCHLLLLPYQQVRPLLSLPENPVNHLEEKGPSC